MSKDEIALQIFAAGVQQAQANGRQLKPGATSRLQGLASSAADQVLGPGPHAQTAWEGLSLDQRLSAGTTNMALLVDRMHAEAAGIPGYSADELGEQTLDLAMSKGFCPCWPIC